MLILKEIVAVAVSVPLKTPVKMAGIQITAADNLIVRAVDSDGRIGWGEAASAPTMTGELPLGMLSAARYLANALTGSEIEDPLAICSRLDQLLYGNFGPKAAIELAILDLAGQALGVPVYQLFGEPQRTSTEILTMVAGGGPEAEVANARRQADAGFRAFKVKVGVNPAERDLQRVYTIRKALGNSVQISADANQGFSREQARIFAQGAEQAGLDFMEQLVDGHDLQGMALCAGDTTVPLGADEGIHGIADIRHHQQANAASGGSIKSIKLGGLHPTLQAGTLMHQLGMHVNLAGKVAETSIASAGIAHLAMAMPQLDWATSVTNQYLADDVAINPVAIVDGSISALQRPGLGIEVDEQKLDRYTLEISS
jgi:muconate cycloisomerase